MASDASTSANLRDYEEQLNKLDSDDIRVPNQSLILDYFCTNQELTDFLRDEVFLTSSRRNETWRKLNQRARGLSGEIQANEISFLLVYSDKTSPGVWADILRLTASKQEHQEVVDYINGNNFGQYNSSVNEECSLGRVSEIECEARAKVSTELIQRPSREKVSKDSSGPQIQQSNTDFVSVGIGNNRRLPMLVGSLAILGALAVVISTAPYETTSTNQHNTSSATTALDTPEAVKSLSDLEAEQKGAVLMCEHQPIIDRAKSVSLVEPQNIRKLNALIESSDKQIKFLNQKSAKGYAYWEDPSCTWGQQWFDNDADNNFRLFLAISRKCTTPTLRYVLAKDKDRKVILSEGVYNAYGHSIGEIRIPYPQESAYIFVDKVACS